MTANDEPADGYSPLARRGGLRLCRCGGVLLCAESVAAGLCLLCREAEREKAVAAVAPPVDLGGESG